MNDLTPALLAGVPMRIVPKDACCRCVDDIEIQAVVAVLGWLPVCESCEAVLEAEVVLREGKR